jgi:hypothetical protein
LVTGIVVNFGRISPNPVISASSSFKSTWIFRSLFVRESKLLEMTCRYYYLEALVTNHPAAEAL